jgi:hypothetical protein
MDSQEDTVGRVEHSSERPDKKDADVVRLLEEWIENAQLSEKDIYRTFAKTEFEQRLRSYRWLGRVWRGAQILTWLAIALLGLLGSILAATNTASTIAIVAGALVGILTTFSHAAHPGRQADGYESARLAIRDEAWALLCKTDSYEKKDAKSLTTEEEIRTFVKHIRTTVKLKRAATRISDLS